MIAYCRTCKQDTIVKPQPGAACSFCDTTIVLACRACAGPVYPKARGRFPHYCDACKKATTRRKPSAS